MDRYKLYSDLIKLHVISLYEMIHPIDFEKINHISMEKREYDALNLYKHDYIFNKRVKTLVTSTMMLIDKYIDKQP